MMNDFRAQSNLNALYCSEYQSAQILIEIVYAQCILKITIGKKSVIAIGNFKCIKIVGYSEIANNFKFIFGSSIIMKQ